MNKINRKMIIQTAMAGFVFILGGCLAMMIHSSFAIDIPDTLDHLPTKKDITTTSLVSGRYDQDKKVNSDASSLALKYMVEMKSNSFLVTLPNEFIRMEVLEFDEHGNYIGLTDVAHLDYFTKNTETKYLILSFYKMDQTGQKIESNYDTLYQEFANGDLAFEELNDINSEEIATRQSAITTYLSPKTFLNVANYKPGMHETGWSAGTQYTYNTGVSSRNYYKVTPGTKYYVSGSDSRYIIFVQWRDANGNWLKSAYDYNGGRGHTTITVPEKAVSMSITMSTQYNKLSASSLVFTYGCRVSLNTDDYYFKDTPKVDRNIEIGNSEEWRTGNYGYQGTEYYNTLDTYASKYFYKNTYGNKKIQYKSGNDNFKLKIIQFDESGTSLGSTTLITDQKITFKSNCAYYAFIIENTIELGNNSRIDFLDALKDGLDISFGEYVPYRHNTVMKDITNRELMNKLTVGWNLGNSFESHNSKFVESEKYWDVETYWGNPYVTENLIKYVKSLGFNNIRIPVSYINNFYLDANGNYVVRQEVFERVQEVIDYALKYDMYVVINMHFDAGMSASPIKVGSENEAWELAMKYSKQIWTQVANYFKDYDEHLMFESYNEVDNPYVSRTCTELAAAQMNELNQIFVDAVRSTGGNNTKRILQLQTFLSERTKNALNLFEVPNDIYPNKLIAQVHNYPSTWDEKIEEAFDDLDRFTERTGLPVVVGEFGYTKSFSPSTFRYTGISNYIARAKKHNIVVYVWDNNSDYAVIYRKTLTSDPKYIDALFNPKEYTTGEKDVLEKYSDFICGKIRVSQGTIENVYDGWGTIISNYIPVKENSNFLQIDLTSLNDAETRKMHYVLFFDENKTYLKDYTINIGYPGFNSKFIVVPDNAKYVVFGINSSQNKTTCKDYQNYFADGDLKLYYKFLNVEIDRTLLDMPISEGETKYTSLSDFEWGMLYSGSGEVKVNDGWGEIATPYIEFKEGDTKFNFNFPHRASAKVAVRHVAFYDENKQYISEGAINNSTSSGLTKETLNIPSGAKYVRLGITGLNNFHKPDYQMMFATGDCVLIFSSN